MSYTTSNTKSLFTISMDAVWHFIDNESGISHTLDLSSLSDGDRNWIIQRVFQYGFNRALNDARAGKDGFEARAAVAKRFDSMLDKTWKVGTGGGAKITLEERAYVESATAWLRSRGIKAKDIKKSADDIRVQVIDIVAILVASRKGIPSADVSTADALKVYEQSWNDNKLFRPHYEKLLAAYSATVPGVSDITLDI